MFIWKVIVAKPGFRKVYRIKGSPEMTNQEVFDKAKAFARKRRAEADAYTTVDLVSCTKAYAPKPDTRIPKNYYWCPYCVKPRIFTEDRVLGVKRCLTCGVSENDFHVKKFNHVFRDEYHDYLLNMKPSKEGI